jgi:arabinofuranosyltransferase
MATPTSNPRVLLAALLLAWLGGALAFWFVCDDAYISFRYAKHWAAGEGVRFNLGPEAPVEGYSNFLWVMIAAAVEWVGLRPDMVMPVVSLASGIGALLLVHRVARERLGLGEAAALVSVLSLGAAPGFVVWGTGGLETMSSALMLLVLFDAAVLDPREGSWRRGALAGLALALLRTEGIGWVVVATVLGGLVRLQERREDGPSRLAALLGAVGAGFALFLAWRWSVYGDWVANTAHAKLGMSVDRLERGWAYLFGFWLASPSALIALFGVWPAWRLAGWSGLLVGAMAVGVQLFALLVGGDFMTMGRLIVAGLPFSALLVGAAVEWVVRSAPGRARLALGGAVLLAVIGALPLGNLHVVPEGVRAGYRVRFNTSRYRSEYEQWRFMRTNAAQWTRLGQALHTIEKPGESIVLGAIGAIAYHCELFVFDRFGLVTREVALREDHGTVKRQSPGHDKQVPISFFLDREPTYVRATLLDVAELGRAVRQAEAWANSGSLRSTYAPRLHPVEIDGETQFLLVLAFAGEEKAERKWKAFKRRVDELRAEHGVAGEDAGAEDTEL